MLEILARFVDWKTVGFFDGVAWFFELVAVSRIVCRFCGLRLRGVYPWWLGESGSARDPAACTPQVHLPRGQGGSSNKVSTYEW